MMTTPIKELTKHSLEKLPDQDLLFLIQAFADRRTDHENIKNLINGDVDILGMMAESDRVFQKVMDQSTAILNISSYFFFALLLRRAFCDLRKDPEAIGNAITRLNQHCPIIPWSFERAEKLLENKSITNYLANMISAFTRNSRLFKISQTEDRSYYYLVDLIQDCQDSNSERCFWIYCHIGNFSLFMTGLFPEFIEHRNKYRRRPIDEHFYIDFGKTYYNLASSHQLARQGELETVFSQLSSGFELIKQSLNFMSKRYLRN